MRRSRKLIAGPVLAISFSLLMIVGPASAGADGTHAAPLDGIKAAIVRSFGLCSDVGGGWTDINDNWQNYGSIPVTVDFSDPSLCNTQITYGALAASGADVVIFSDPCGISRHGYSNEEMNAFRQYAREGHNVLGTFGLFGSTCSNTKMASLFGYRTLAYEPTSAPMPKPFHEFDPNNPLFRNLPNPFQSEGWLQTATPPDGTWSRNELAGAVYLAKTDAVSEGIISVFTTPQYSAIYISSMPEFEGGADDSQFLYNAIIYPSTG